MCHDYLTYRCMRSHPTSLRKSRGCGLACGDCFEVGCAAQSGLVGCSLHPSLTSQLVNATMLDCGQQMHLLTTLFLQDLHRNSQVNHQRCMAKYTPFSFLEHLTKKQCCCEGFSCSGGQGFVARWKVSEARPGLRKVYQCLNSSFEVLAVSFVLFHLSLTLSCLDSSPKLFPSLTIPCSQLYTCYFCCASSCTHFALSQASSVVGLGFLLRSDHVCLGVCNQSCKVFQQCFDPAFGVLVFNIHVGLRCTD